MHPANGTAPLDGRYRLNSNTCYGAAPKQMNAFRFLPRAGVLTSLIALAACGGGDSSAPPPSGPAAIGTLAYVDTVCHEDATSSSASQKLQVVRGNAAPMTVAEIPTYGQLGPLGLCSGFGALRDGNTSVFALAVQRLGVSPDGSGVVFEVTLQNSLLSALGVPNPLTAEQEGIFYVRADGTGMRRLGDPSREPAHRLIGPPTAPTSVYSDYLLWFSPNGRSITFIDRGPGPDGEDAPQVFVLDIATRTRQQVTHLPDAAPDPSAPAFPTTDFAAFPGPDDATILYSSRVNPNGLNPEGQRRLFTVKTDGTGLTELPAIAVGSGGMIVPRFFITSSATFFDVNSVNLPTSPLNPSPYWTTVSEVFVTAPDHELQLTNFHRGDTGGNVNTDGERAFFAASANPFGTNASENCQIFSISVLGDDLRQLTQFRAADHSTIGCASDVAQQPGCTIYPNELVLDPQTRTLLFPSDCDPLGGNLNGKQYFAMRSDGTGLRQLSTTLGVVTNPDGSVDVELPGPYGYDGF